MTPLAWMSRVTWALPRKAYLLAMPKLEPRHETGLSFYHIGSKFHDGGSWRWQSLPSWSRNAGTGRRQLSPRRRPQLTEPRSWLPGLSLPPTQISCSLPRPARRVWSIGRVRSIQHGIAGRCLCPRRSSRPDRWSQPPGTPYNAGRVSLWSVPWV